MYTEVMVQDITLNACFVLFKITSDKSLNTHIFFIIIELFIL